MKTLPFVKSYGGIPALTLPELEFTPGRVCAVIGTNGSGKSTLAKTLAGVLKADDGVTPLNRKAAVAYLPQKHYAFAMSVRRNVMLACGDRARADELMEALHISALAKRRAVTLSGGETARMALARTLLCPCDMLILDEPTAEMDMESTLTAEQLMLRHCRETGCALLLITHSLAQARRIADDALFLWEGSLCEMGEAKKVLYQPENARTRQFLEFYGER